jgi:hypothetical protein
MRYYSIVLNDGSPPSNFPAVTGAPVSGASWSSLVGGQSDPGALDVELDIITSGFATPVGGSSLRLWGVSLQQIAQASQLNKVTVDIYAGMAKGLPLADPSQQGLIAHGTIWPAFGNWIETDQTLDFVIQAPFTGSGTNALPDSPNNPAPIVHNWQQGQPLSTAVKSALSTAFPGFQVNVSISPSLVLNYNDVGVYMTIEAYANYIRKISQSIMGKSSYPGVQITTVGKTLVVTDDTQAAASTKQINFQDLVGQPTWLGLNVVQVKTVMRGDISTRDTVMLPQTLATTSAASSPQFRQNSAFQGKFFVKQTRHIGRFRQPDAASWVSVFDLAALNSPVG